MLKLIELIAPSVANWKCNQSIRKKLETETGLDTPSVTVPLEELSVEKLEKLYNTDIQAKERLEDKAKTNVVGVTISITLIIGAYSMMQNISEKHSNGVLIWLSFFLFVISVLYMLTAGVHAVHVLTAENTVHTVSIELEGDLLKKDLDKKIGLNRARNTLRNNYIYTSYECIRNALLCLFVVMVIAIIPLQKGDYESESAWHGSYYLSADAMSSINSGIDLSLVTNYIESQPKNEGTVAVVDEENNLFVKYSIDGDNVIIFLIEPYS